MLNYMRAELWRFFRRSAGKALFLTAALLPALLNLYVLFFNLWDRPAERYDLSISLEMALALMPLAGVLLLSVAYLVDSTYNPFIYWNF